MLLKWGLRVDAAVRATMPMFARPSARNVRGPAVLLRASILPRIAGIGTNNQARIKQARTHNEAYANFCIEDSVIRRKQKTVAGASHRNPEASERLPNTGGKWRSVSVHWRKCDVIRKSGVFRGENMRIPG